jgi:hypothetical protein
MHGRLAPVQTWEHRLRRRDDSWLSVESTVNDLLDDPASAASLSRRAT